MPLTFGNNAAPSQITQYFDALFTQSLANYRKGLVDNIGASNAFLYDLIKSGSYESAEGGTYFAEPLMYALSPFDSYDGYDELSTTTTDGISEAIYEWRQGATPISYSMKEVIQNKNRLTDMVKSKMTQGQMGIQEGFAQALMWGNYPQLGTAASLITPRQSTVNSSLFIEPITKLIMFDPTTSTEIGNINQNSKDWWRNKTATSAATTYSGFLYELENMYNTVALGTGGPCTHILMDQTTYQLFIHAYFSVFKASPDALDNSYPFVGKKFMNAKVIMDDKVPDVFTGAVGTPVGGVTPNTLTYGTAMFINEKFFKLRYQPDRDFEMLTDEHGKTFAKPINGDSRVGHMAWMGQLTTNRRNKHGVLGKIARTLT